MLIERQIYHNFQMIHLRKNALGITIIVNTYYKLNKKYKSHDFTFSVGPFIPP